MKTDIICPSAELNRNERIKLLFSNLDEWMQSEAMISLIEIFGGDIQELNGKKNRHELISWLKQFTEIWDQRSNGKLERMFLEDTEFMKERQETIIEKVKELGLIGKTNLNNTDLPADYILPLGGARYTNLHRPLMAKKIIDKYGWHNSKIVGLSGIRPLNEMEMEAARSYSDDATNEYELMCAGIEKAFGVKGISVKETRNDNVFLTSCVKEFDNNIFVIAAPSSNPERRANSVDTYKFFFQTFKCREGDRIILVTSQIYVGVQLLQFVPLALEYGVDVDSVGVDNEISGTGLSKTVNYLQEIRATINLIDMLFSKYEDKL